MTSTKTFNTSGILPSVPTKQVNNNSILYINNNTWYYIVYQNYTLPGTQQGGILDFGWTLLYQVNTVV